MEESKKQFPGTGRERKVPIFYLFLPDFFHSINENKGLSSVLEVLSLQWPTWGVCIKPHRGVRAYRGPVMRPTRAGLQVPSRAVAERLRRRSNAVCPSSPGND